MKCAAMVQRRDQFGGDDGRQDGGEGMDIAMASRARTLRPKPAS